MKSNNIGYLIKEGIRGIFLHGFMSFAAVCVTVACLLILGVFFCLVYNVNVIVDELNKTNEVVVYIDSELPDAEALQVDTLIGISSDNIADCVFVSREDALKDFIADHQGDDAFSGVEAADLRHRCVVILKDNRLMKETVQELEAIPGVAKISAPYELAEGFTTLSDVLEVVSAAVILILLAVSLLIISNTVKLAMYDRKEEIAIMKMVGATNGFIRLPFVVEGFLLGMVGAGGAFGLMWAMYDALVLRINSADALELFQFVPFTVVSAPVLTIFLGAGLFVGVVGSWTSIRKFMNV